MEKEPSIEAAEDTLKISEVETDVHIPTADAFLVRLEKSGTEKHIEAYTTAIAIARAVEEAGGKALFVGGTVRDTLRGKISKDFDLEVYKLSPAKVSAIVKSVGYAREVGKQFGILKLTFGDDIDVDVSMPRTDSQTGAEHTDVDVKIDPNMSVKEAARRRDFTVNSLAADPFTGAVYDGYNGLEDLKNKTLRVTDKKLFGDDVLRAVRAMQFVARLGFSIEPESAQIIRDMAPKLKHLPAERHFKEWEKMLLQAEKPSLGLIAALDLGILKEMHPEFLSLKDTPQEYEWHPEGDVWIHTLMAIDEAARIIRREHLDHDQALTVMLGTLAHDLGKPATTTAEDGRIRSKAHEQAGAEPTGSFLEAIHVSPAIRQKVMRIVENHLAPGVFYNQEVLKGKSISRGAIRKLATRIDPATIYELTLVGEADHLGRGPFEDPETQDQLLLPLGEYPAGPWLLKRAREVRVELSKPLPLLQGRDVLALGFRTKQDGRLIGQIMILANRLRDEKDYTREQVLAEIIDTKDPADAVAILSGIAGPEPKPEHAESVEK